MTVDVEVVLDQVLASFSDDEVTDFISEKTELTDQEVSVALSAICRVLSS